tara:strand:+ start:657 stop:1115 length:459 start_codon:yes stop_codon:yes gene_type:complete
MTLISKHKIVVFFFYLSLIVNLSFCSVTLQTEDQDTAATSTTIELTFCDEIEIEYVEYSNQLFDNTKQFNIFLDEISPESIDVDRKTFFDEIEINYKYREVYVSYLEVRLDNLNNIYTLLTENIDCYFPDDQTIALEQIIKAQNELDTFLNQ